MVQVTEKENRTATIKEAGYQFDIAISGDSLTAHLAILQIDPKAKFSFSVEQLISILNRAGVVFGIKTEQLEKLVDEPIIGRRIEIARGIPPERGQDGSFELLFQKETSKTPVVGQDGLIDYKSLNLVQNATVGQPLARRIPPQRGRPGRGVDGQEIPGLLGRERSLPKGKNTDVSPDDPDLLVATESGVIKFLNNVVSIEKIFKVPHDVDFSTGNIECLGNLQIGGTIRAGFSVKAEGTIEVGGNVEDAQVVSGGSVIVNGGFIGSGKGLIKAKEDVFVKFVENGRIEAGNNVNVGGEALNAQIEAGNAVILKGRKAIILGGQVTAFNLIEADCIGSDLGTKTIVRVGYNPTLMKEYLNTDSELKRLKTDYERIKQAVYSLTRLQIDGKLNELQAEALARLKEARDEIPQQLEYLSRVKEELSQKLNENKQAKIVVRGTAYHGSQIEIGPLKKEIDRDVSHCCFRVCRDQIVTVTQT